MRYGKDTMKQASDLIQSLNAPFHKHMRNNFHMLIRLAKDYHRIQEHNCNGTNTPRMVTREANIERSIIAIAEEYGLNVTFSGDPRGYCVKLHTPNNTLWNTWGGSESGYGIG